MFEREALHIARELVGQDLDRDIAIEPGIAGTIHVAHAAGAERSNDFVRAEARAGGEAQGVCRAYDAAKNSASGNAK